MCLPSGGLSHIFENTVIGVAAAGAAKANGTLLRPAHNVRWSVFRFYSACRALPSGRRRDDDQEDLLIRRRRQSCDVRKWSRDLARCVRVIHYIPIIDRGAADLERSTTIDRPSGHLTLERWSRDCVEKAADT